MSNWAVYRGDKLLGHFVAEYLGVEGGMLYAYRDGRRVRAVASGHGLRWEKELMEGKDAELKAAEDQ